STATGAAATAGTHIITATGGTAANYEVATANGTLTVSQAAALTATADAKSKVYGAADPTLTYTPSGTLYYSDTYSVISGGAPQRCPPRPARRPRPAPTPSPPRAAPRPTTTWWMPTARSRSARRRR